MQSQHVPQGEGLQIQPAGILTGSSAMAAFHQLARGGGRTITAQIMDGNGQGQTVQLALQPEDVHISEEISSYLAGYSPWAFMADVAAPLVTSVEQTFDQYRVFTTANTFRQASVLASTQSAINEVDPETILQSYRTVDRALGGFIPNITEASEAKLFNGRRALARRIGDALSLNREMRVFGPVGLLSTAGSFAAGNQFTIAGGDEWDTNLGNPIADINEVIQASAQPITDGFINTETMNAMLANENFRTHNLAIRGDAGIEQLVTSGAAAGERAFRIPGFNFIMHEVPAKVLNESTNVLDPVLTDVAIFISRLPSGVPVSGMDIVTAQTFRFTGLGASDGFITREFPVEARGLAGGTMMVSGHSEDIVMVATNVGGHISNTLA